MRTVSRPGWGTVLRLCLGLLATSVAAQTNFHQGYESLRLNREKIAEPERLRRLFDLRWRQIMMENPEFATYTGYPGQNDRWSDVSLAEIKRRKTELSEPLEVAKTVNRSELGPRDQLNYDLFRYNLERDIAGIRFPQELFSLHQLSGVHQEVAQTLSIAPAASTKDFQDMIERLKRVPTLVDQNIELLKEGIAQQITLPRAPLRDVADQIRNLTIKDPVRNPMMEPFQHLSKNISEAEQNRLKKSAWEVVSSEAIPAFERLHQFFAEVYYPATREKVGLNSLRGGTEWYAYNVERATTTAMTPRQIHDLGQSEVKRIRLEMDKIIRKLEFKGTFSEFCGFLRSDPRFFYTNKESLLQGYRDIAKRADPELIKLFGKLPRLPYGVLPVPSYAEKSQTTAYYQPGTGEAGRAGNFFANTYALETRPRWEMEALTLHEAVPGHHLQIALAQEMEQQPEFRRFGEYTAFVEGWGLYAESLGEEMGFYQDPYSKFGQLTYEMWRAVRLVVDTGMHSFGWTREQAIDFFKKNSSKTEHDITVEIDRYIVWPGQALAYKIGELKIKELRRYTQSELGERFNIREFHDHVLGDGALPLEILERRIKQWVAERKKENN